MRARVLGMLQHPKMYLPNLVSASSQRKATFGGKMLFIDDVLFF